jgi:tetratricopeptide (TPR) repeat protein
MKRNTAAFLLVALFPVVPAAAGAQASGTLADQAQAAINNKQWKQADQLLTQLLAADPKNANAYYLRAYAEYYLKQYTAAIKDLDRAQSLKPGDPDAASLRGDTFYAQEHYVAAIAAYSAAIPLSTDSKALATMYGRRADSEESLDRHAAAISDYNKVLDLKPNDTTTLHALANVYYAAGNDAACERTLYRAIAAAPNDNWSYGHLGVFRWTKRRYNDSLTAFTKAIALAPKDYGLYDDRAIVYASAGSLSRALADSDKAIGLQSSSSPLDTRAILYWIAGQTGEAVAAFGVAIAKGSDDALANRGVLYLTLGGNQLAASDLQSAFTKSQKKGYDDGDTAAILAIVYRRLHQNQRALVLLRAAHVPPDTWSKAVLSFLRGEIPAPALLAASNTPSERSGAITDIALDAATRGRPIDRTGLTWVTNHATTLDWNLYLARWLLSRS